MSGISDSVKPYQVDPRSVAEQDHAVSQKNWQQCHDKISDAYKNGLAKVQCGWMQDHHLRDLTKKVATLKPCENSLELMRHLSAGKGGLPVGYQEVRGHVDVYLKDPVKSSSK